MALSGGCRCGACQTMSGGGFALQALIPASRVSIEGEVIVWSNPNAQGGVTTQRFCKLCETRIYSTNDGRPGIVLVRAGTLDDSVDIIPTVHMWVRRKQAWIGLPADAETYDEAIPLDRVGAIFAPNFA